MFEKVYFAFGYACALQTIIGAVTDVSAECDRPDIVVNGMLEFNRSINERGKFAEGTQATYFCKVEYELVPADSRFRICQAGSWSGTNPSCAIAKNGGCLPPEPIVNGYYDSGEMVEKYKHGDKISYSCKPEYFLTGPSVRKCAANGEWYPRRTPWCAPSLDTLHDGSLSFSAYCEPLPNIALKLVPSILRSNDVHRNLLYTAECKKGFRDTKVPCRPSVLYCDNGAWSGSIPNCVKADHCLPPAEIEHATAVSSSSHTRYPLLSEVEFMCHRGYFPHPPDTLKFRCSESGCWVPEAVSNCFPDIGHLRSKEESGWNARTHVKLLNGSAPVFKAASDCSYEDYIHISTAGLLMSVALAVMGIASIMTAVCILNVCRHRYLHIQRRNRITRNRFRYPPHPPPPPFGTYDREFQRDSRYNGYNRMAVITVTAQNPLEQYYLPTYDEVMRQDGGPQISAAAAQSTTNCGTSNEGDESTNPLMPPSNTNGSFVAVPGYSIQMVICNNGNNNGQSISASPSASDLTRQNSGGINAVVVTTVGENSSSSNSPADSSCRIETTLRSNHSSSVSLHSLYLQGSAIQAQWLDDNNQK